MERGSSDVAASLLATELKGGSQSSESLRAGRPKAAATDAAADSFPGRRRTNRTQVQSLLEDQRRFALRDGVALPQLYSSSEGISATDYRVGGVALSRLPDMFGQGALSATALTSPTHMNAALSTSAVATALQDAVLCWGASSSSSATRGGAVGICHRSVGSSGAISVPHVRRSWRLIEVTHRRAVPSTSSPSPSANWSVGQRWERADHVAQVNALARAVWAELVTQPARVQAAPLPIGLERSDADCLYASGLRMCFDSTRSTASLPAFASAASSNVLVRTEVEDTREESTVHGCGCSLLSAASGKLTSASSPSLAFFTFTESEYDAIVPPPPPSTRFTYASSCYLVQLWARFGNPVVTVDRWRWPEGDDEEGRGKGERWVPSVEEVCAEYHRITVGVLRQRRQRLLDAVQSQQLHLLSESSPAPSPTTRATRGGGRKVTEATVDEGGSAVAGGASTTAASHHVHPFVASFDRYALLHTAAADDAGAAPAPSQQALSTAKGRDGGHSVSLLPSQLSPPPVPPSSHGSSAEIAATACGDSGSLTLDVPPSPPPAGSTATAQERLTALATPNAWFAHDAEVHRRACLARLLRQEQQANVPYQQAANRYLALVAGAAVALQRAVFAFYSRGEEAGIAEAPMWEEGAAGDFTGHANLTEADVHLGASSLSSCLLGRPPRSAFTVQLRPLPSVDPAAWRAAEVAVHKAAAEVLGTMSSAAPPPVAADAASPSRCPPRSAAAVVGSQKRTRSATAERATTAGRRKGRVAVAKSAPEGAAADTLAQLNNGDDEAADSEASAPSETGSAFSDDEQALEDSVAGEEGDGGVKMGFTEEQRQRHSTQPSPPKLPPSRPRHSVGAGAVHSQASQLPADASYAALQAYITDVLPFRCARLRGVVQAGWLLPAPPALPHTLTNPIEEEEVCTVDAQVRGSTGAEIWPTPAFPSSSSAPQQEQAPMTGDTAAAQSQNSTLLAPILTEEEYQQLRKVSTAGVCNRVVSHTDEAVLLSLPSAVSRLHREVEQELERYLYEDTSALMEVNPIAQSLVDAIRVAYTQNKLLQRFATRLEHVLEGLKKVSEECEEEAQAMPRVP
ncbi:conserved hypothetical protein [Leishmania mexicana MHOM/GT/2001/U1103]|uniref:Uncharacterized protein n=1 Tax=Leishmania mexicana (strain MHOM/GT/2001/U1103) TaxID=929439 RepID=E9APT3_LEIMU|nr:conserved hypothetical protein [Leishmania mexicana MHOM/GT/2001/U1103]CBZ24950.1 conserved hypothetical protein [Leishmania mexicana MHOM/GT/2001/U1103]